MQNIIIFSDLHGRIPLMFRLLWQFQKERNIKADLVLITGDIGVWPDEKKLDKETSKRHRTEPLELGFQIFQPVEGYGEINNELYEKEKLQWKELIKKIIHSIDCKIIFIGGNHEDYDYLLFCAEKFRFQELIPVERRGKILWLRPETLYIHNGIKITGISGFDPEGAHRNPKSYHPFLIVNAEKTLDLLDKTGGKKVDIFLSHDGLESSVKEGLGSEHQEVIISELNPVYHFFGHYHSAKKPLKYSGIYADLKKIRTLGVHINKLGFLKDGSLRKNIIGLLKWKNEKEHSFEFVDDKWLKSITFNNWTKIHPRK